MEAINEENWDLQTPLVDTCTLFRPKCHEEKLFENQVVALFTFDALQEPKQYVL